MDTTVRKQRPVFLNLLRIRMPVTALLSIAHRVSGVLLFAAIPVAIYMLDWSLRGPESYAELAAFFDYRAVRVMTALLLWAYAHHLLAGIRFILLDMDVGIRLDRARITAWGVNLVGLAVFLLALGRWW